MVCASAMKFRRASADLGLISGDSKVILIIYSLICKGTSLAQDATPDIVTMAKGIGNGFPMGAVVTTKEVS